MKKLKLLASAVLVSIGFSILQLQAADDKAQREADAKVEEERHLVEVRAPIPPIVQGHEKNYQRFLNGMLIYRPNRDGNDVGRINLPIRDLNNPLEDTFDLSQCGEMEKYFSISTGYRKGKKPENEKRLEIWFSPQFLIKGELSTTAKHFQPIFGNWKESTEVGIFWTWGGWGADDTDMDYLVTETMDDLSKVNLYENWKKSAGVLRPAVRKGGPAAGRLPGGISSVFSICF